MGDILCVLGGIRNDRLADMPVMRRKPSARGVRDADDRMEFASRPVPVAVA